MAAGPAPGSHRVIWRSDDPRRDSPRGSLGWMALAVALCAILILPITWSAFQGWIFPDALSYLDLTSAAARHSPAVLLKNAYWSPAYPAAP